MILKFFRFQPSFPFCVSLSLSLPRRSVSQDGSCRATGSQDEREVSRDRFSCLPRSSRRAWRRLCGNASRALILRSTLGGRGVAGPACSCTVLVGSGSFSSVSHALFVRSSRCSRRLAWWTLLFLTQVLIPRRRVGSCAGGSSRQPLWFIVCRRPWSITRSAMADILLREITTESS